MTMRSKISVSVVGVLCVAAVWVLHLLYQRLTLMYQQSAVLTDTEYSWVFRLLLNMVGYSAILLPLFILYKYVDKTRYFDNIGSTGGPAARALFACFGEPAERLPESKRREPESESPRRRSLELVLCFGGLMMAYLVWGLLQEKIMTQSYAMADGTHVRFHDSQFLVFANRLLALALAAAWLRATRQALLPAPLYQFSYCSLTNVLSAWCQYEALKYVSFPTQVLSKSCKVVPVMLMGKLVSRNTYELYEYVTAALISLGMVLFMMGSHHQAVVGAAVSWSGAALLALYMCADSFTASWQSALFARTACRPLQMLCAVNLFSCALTAPPLAAYAHLAPLLQHPVFVTDCVLLSLSSALGQLLIYRTIASFGAVVFTIIMTLRQAASILLSCAVYGHRVSAAGGAGVLLVLGAVLLRLYARHRLQRRRPATL